jgi:hypothetical protein
MSVKFYLILGHILDFYGYIFCEFAFQINNLMDKYLVWNDEKERYNGVLGYIFNCVCSHWSYKLGCWFYSKAQTLAWDYVPNEFYPVRGEKTNDK